MKFLVLVFVSAIAFAQTAEDDAVIAVVQKLFDGMAGKDAGAMRATMAPEARLFTVRGDGTPVAMTGEDFVTRIGGAKAALIERFTARPQVLIHGRIAQVWGDYEFLQDGKFGHCGVDTATLFKTETGWKIAALGWTSETTGCKGQPK